MHNDVFHFNLYISIYTFPYINDIFIYNNHIKTLTFHLVDSDYFVIVGTAKRNNKKE